MEKGNTVGQKGTSAGTRATRRSAVLKRPRMNTAYICFVYTYFQLIQLIEIELSHTQKCIKAEIKVYYYHIHIFAIVVLLPGMGLTGKSYFWEKIFYYR